MKKTLSILFLILAVLSVFVGCDNDFDVPENNNGGGNTESSTDTKVVLYDKDGNIVTSHIFSFTTSTNFTVLAGKEYSIKVFEEDIFGDGEEVTSNATFTLDGANWTNTKFTPKNGDALSFTVKSLGKTYSFGVEAYNANEMFDFSISSIFVEGFTWGNCECVYYYLTEEGTAAQKVDVLLSSEDVPENLSVFAVTDSEYEAIVEKGVFAEGKTIEAGTEGLFVTLENFDGSGALPKGEYKEITVISPSDATKKLSQDFKNLTEDKTIADIIGRFGVFFYTGETRISTAVLAFKDSMSEFTFKIDGEVKASDYIIESTVENLEIAITHPMVTEPLIFTVNPTN